MKLDRCVTAVILGFQSIDDSMKTTQFRYREEEKKRNFLTGEPVEFAEYLLDHFTPPGSTILDISGDPKGIYTYKYSTCICKSQFCHKVVQLYLIVCDHLLGNGLFHWRHVSVPKF